MKDVADETVTDAGFQSANLVEKVVEGLSDVLQPAENYTEDTLFQMENATNQSTQMLPQLVQQTQQMKMILAQVQTHFKNNNKNGNNCVNYNSTNGDNNIRTPFLRLLYYWTHGACNHQGSRCHSKTEGHKDTEKFDSHLNRSNRNVHHHDKKNNA